MLARVFTGKNPQGVFLEILLLTVILGMVMGSSSAASYDQWVLAGTNSTLGSYTLYSTIDKGWEIASIFLSDDIIILSKDECESNLEYEICFLDTRFDINKGWGRFDVATDRMTPELHFTFEELIPQLGLEQKTDKTSPFLEEEMIMRILISFQGDTPLKNLSLREEIPASVTITDLGDFRLVDGILRWDWPIMSGEKTLTYKIKFNQHANVTLTTNITGVYPTGLRLSRSNSLALNTVPMPNPLSQSASLSTSQPLLGDTLTYKLIVANSENKENPVNNLLITFPGKMTLIRGDDRLESAGSGFRWSGTVPANGQQQFEISFRPEHTGRYNVTSELKNTFYDSLQSKYFSATNSIRSDFDVKLSQLAPRISFMFNKKQLNPKEQSNVRVYISNPDPKSILFDINTTIETNLLGIYVINIERLAPGQEKELLYIPFTAPSSTQDTTLSVAFAGTYRTWYFENFSFKISDSLSIKSDPNATVFVPIVYNVTQIKNETELEVAGAPNSTALSQNATAPGSEQAAPEPEQPSSDETSTQENVFTKIINWFKRLFGGK